MPRYSKKHYEDVARIMAKLNLVYGIHNAHDTQLIGYAMHEFAMLFKADNATFDILKFAGACQDTRNAKEIK